MNEYRIGELLKGLRRDLAKEANDVRLYNGAGVVGIFCERAERLRERYLKKTDAPAFRELADATIARVRKEGLDAVAASLQAEVAAEAAAS